MIPSGKALPGETALLSADIAFPGNTAAFDADRSAEEALKVKLAGEIQAIIKSRKLTQTAAAELLGLRQPDVSAIVTGRVAKFSIGRLLRCLDRLDHRAHVEVRPKPPSERRLPWAP